MKHDQVKELRDVAKIIRAGGEVEGWSVEGDMVIEVPTGRRWRVNGSSRLNVVELKRQVTDRFVAVRGDPPPERLALPCTECGKPFERSKYNPYFMKCPDCRRVERKGVGEDRKFVCLKCGKDFWISKYHPYLNPSQCQHCNRNEGIRRRLKRRLERRRLSGRPTT